jgi:hypothetical protein
MAGVFAWCGEARGGGGGRARRRQSAAGARRAKCNVGAAKPRHTCSDADNQTAVCVLPHAPHSRIVSPASMRTPSRAAPENTTKRRRQMAGAQGTGGRSLWSARLCAPFFPLSLSSFFPILHACTSPLRSALLSALLCAVPFGLRALAACGSRRTRKGPPRNDKNRTTHRAQQQQRTSNASSSAGSNGERRADRWLVDWTALSRIPVPTRHSVSLARSKTPLSASCCSTPLQFGTFESPPWRPPYMRRACALALLPPPLSLLLLRRLLAEACHPQ